jgi:hypothetical protein
MKNIFLTKAALNEVNTMYQKNGLCIQCGNKRGENGTKWECRNCADKHNAATRKRRKLKKKNGNI